jgi:hypothetical protein
MSNKRDYSLNNKRKMLKVCLPLELKKMKKKEEEEEEE